MKRFCGLYGISDNALTPKDSIFSKLDSAISGGLRIFQYRDKDGSDEEIESLVLELQKFCREKNVLFVLNDRYQLGIKLGVDAIHLGREDIDNFSYIRKSFSGFIGISCYDSISLALKYQDSGADYVAFGAIFPSPTKPSAEHCDISVLSKAREKLKIPICAIGGINVDNARLLECDMIAVISSLWSGDVCENAKKLIESWQSKASEHTCQK